MASDTAVAEAPPRAELEQLLPATFQCFTVFGTSQEREIPKALIDLPRSGGAFRKWYRAQWGQIRYELAALGNIAARESIKKAADRQRVWQQLPANTVHRNERVRLTRRVRALKDARDSERAKDARERARLAKTAAKRKIALEKLERVCLKELAEVRRAKAEENVD